MSKALARLAPKVLPAPNAELIEASEVADLLSQVRPCWQARDLIKRVHRLLPIDPSSACQRLFNAAIHDLREKVRTAGVDIAAEAAKIGKLPPLQSADALEDYPTAKLIDLAYHMGLLSRSEWRRIARVYEIRRDLEHEDDEYQADVADCIYVFKACVEIVLARDPVQPLRVSDVKSLVEQTKSTLPSHQLLEDFERAPDVRQCEILKFLISTALDSEKPDLVRQNAFAALKRLEPRTKASVKVDIGSHVQRRAGRGRLDLAIARVAHAAGVFRFLRKAQQTDFFNELLEQFASVGPHWKQHAAHGSILRTLMEMGALSAIPEPPRSRFVEWLVLCYLGAPGGYGQWGSGRDVFYSNSAAPLIEEIFSGEGPAVRKDLDAASRRPSVKQAMNHAAIARRFECLLDLTVSA